MKIKTQARIDHLEALLRRVREASRFNERNYRVSKYLGSFDAKLLATFEAYEAMSRDSQPDRAELPSIASSLDPWKGTDEPVQVHRKKKSPPYYRTVFEFGIEHRALQYLVREPLTALLTFHPTQYALCGGNHAAIKRTKQALIDGYLWAVELDIKDCYPSFDEEKLSSLLPLPREVIDHVIISRNLHLQDGWRRQFDGPGNHHECDSLKVLSAARQGIPQGSAVSPLVAEAMIAIALEQVPTLGA